MKAKLKNYRQSPRKVRLVADLVRGKKLDKALTLLDFSDKKAARGIKKVVRSASANAKNIGLEVRDLLVGKITVDKGVTIKRWMPRARGRATPINKRTSNISVELR
jgi:large subunit ribosomal protein L22